MYINIYDRKDLEKKTREELIEMVEEFQRRVMTDSKIKIESDHYHLSIELETNIPK